MSKLDIVEKAGHVKGAVSPPSPCMFAKDVKADDGSMQEFAKDPNAPIVKYSWQ